LVVLIRPWMAHSSSRDGNLLLGSRKLVVCRHSTSFSNLARSCSQRWAPVHPIE
jgi:hypothetical protein